MNNLTNDQSFNKDFLGNDLAKLIEVLGEKALMSLWLCKAVECYGQDADELHMVSDQQRRIFGRELLHIVVNLDSIVDGYFSAFRNDETRPWLVIRAIDSGFYEIESTDPLVDQAKQQLQENIRLIIPDKSGADRIVVSIADSLPIIGASLRRIQVEGEIVQNFVIFMADEKKNYYIQVAPESEPSPYTQHVDQYSLYAEAVGNAALNPDYALQSAQVDQIRTLGWKTSSLTPNFYQTWRVRNDYERSLIARTIISTFVKVYGLLPDHKLEVQVWIPNTA